MYTCVLIINIMFKEDNKSHEIFTLSCDRLVDSTLKRGENVTSENSVGALEFVLSRKQRFINLH